MNHFFRNNISNKLFKCIENYQDVRANCHFPGLQMVKRLKADLKKIFFFWKMFDIF